MNPTPDMYVLHNLHGYSLGFHFFILRLNSKRDFDSLISLGRIDHILGPKYDNVFVASDLFYSRYKKINPEKLSTKDIT